MNYQKSYYGDWSLLSQALSTQGISNIALTSYEWCARLTCTEGKSNKFWQIYHVNQSPVIYVQWGRIGSQAQQVEKTFEEAVKKLHEKLRKGYVDDGGWIMEPVGPDRRLSPPFDQIARFVVAAGSNGTIHIAMDEHGVELLRMPHEAAAKFALEHLS